MLVVAKDEGVLVIYTVKYSKSCGTVGLVLIHVFVFDVGFYV